jgi:hypothetical protein
MNLNNFKLDGKTIGIGLLVIVGIFIIGSQLLGNNNNDTNTNTNLPTNNTSSDDGGEIMVGELVSSSGLDSDGCPVDTEDTFEPSDAIYIVAGESDVPAGTDIFARLSREGEPVEDSVLITADEDYVNTCIYFEFEATSGAEVLDSGTYEAQLVVNGNPGPSVDFQVR